MATPSMMITSINRLATEIANARQKMTETRQAIQAIDNTLRALPARYKNILDDTAMPDYAKDTFTEYNKGNLEELLKELSLLQTAVTLALTQLTTGVTEF